MHVDNQDDGQITTALLLAAGRGSRLQPLTNSQPKCLTEVDGVPILERLMDCLREHGFKRLVIVVGYREREIRQFLGDHRGELSIEYVVSPQYRTTNNLYSLWLARDVVEEPFLLVESDVVFAPELLGEMLQPGRIAVSPLQSQMNGTTVSIDESRRVLGFQVDKKSTERLPYKTVNVCSLSAGSWQRVVRRLAQHVAGGRVNEFYERVFAEMVDDGSLAFEAVLWNPELWYEVDTLEDLRVAESLFRMRGRSRARTGRPKPAEPRRSGNQETRGRSPFPGP